MLLIWCIRKNHNTKFENVCKTMLVKFVFFVPLTARHSLGLCGRHFQAMDVPMYHVTVLDVSMYLSPYRRQRLMDAIDALCVEHDF